MFLYLLTGFLMISSVSEIIDANHKALVATYDFMASIKSKCVTVNYFISHIFLTLIP